MTELFFYIFGVLTGGVIGWLLATLQQKKLMTEKEITARSELNKEKELRLISEAELKAVRAIFAEEEMFFQNNFSRQASEALQKNNESFLQLANQLIEKHINKIGNEQLQNSSTLKSYIEPLKENIAQQELLIKEFNEKNNKTIGGLQNYIELLAQSQAQLQKETNNLVTALKAPKVRGRWGEIGLRRIVEFSGLSEFCDFKQQVHQNTESGAIRPDMIIQLPENRTIVVDSKVPLNAYLEATETDDEALKISLSERHAKAVLQHVKDLSAKMYHQQFSQSIDFVILYIEVEPAFGAAMRLKPDLIFEALQKKIVFATPTTLIALLQTVAFTWKQHNATENAEKILEASNELFQRVLKLAEYFEKLESSISSVNKIFEQTVASWNKRVVPAARKLESLKGNNRNEKMELKEIFRENNSE